MERLSLAEASQWLSELQRSGSYDFYDLPGYHAIAQTSGEGQAAMFVFRRGGESILLPLLLRPLSEVEGLGEAASQLADASSVYGYSGPLATDGTCSRSMIEDFHSALREAAGRIGLVSVFARLHPLRDGATLLDGLGEVLDQGPTVSIDLTLTEEEQRARYRPNHRRDLRKLAKLGYECAVEPDRAQLQTFVSLYHETMHRVGASPIYFFDLAYFEALFDLGCFELILCRQAGAVAAGAVMSHVNGIAQYHLGGTTEAHLPAAPMKLVFDAAATWARSAGCSLLHLGGGLGAREDALFNFKAGFSPRRHRFKTWRWTVDAERSAVLEQQRSRWAAETGRSICEDAAFFPPYRRPLA